MAKTKEVRLPVTVFTDGKFHPPGTPIKLDSAEADNYLERYGEMPASKPVAASGVDRKIAALEAENGRLTALAAMNDAQKSFFATLSDEDKQSFLAMSPEDREKLTPAAAANS